MPSFVVLIISPFLTLFLVCSAQERAASRLAEALISSNDAEVQRATDFGILNKFKKVLTIASISGM